MRKVELSNGVHAWAFSSSKYVSESVKCSERHLMRKGLKILSKAETPLQTSYRPELDISPDLGPVDAAYYQSLIDML